jgi:hypothetical protein
MAVLQGDSGPLMLTELRELVTPDTSGAPGMISVREADLLEFLASQPEWRRLITQNTSGHSLPGGLSLVVLLAYAASECERGEARRVRTLCRSWRSV